MWDGTFSGMMGGWSGWGWPFIWLIPLVFLAALIAGVVWLVRSIAAPGGNPPAMERHSPALDTLQERYARGEIGRDEYMQKKGDIDDRR